MDCRIHGLNAAHNVSNPRQKRPRSNSPPSDNGGNVSPAPNRGDSAMHYRGIVPLFSIEWLTPVPANLVLRPRSETGTGGYSRQVVTAGGGIRAALPVTIGRAQSGFVYVAQPQQGELCVSCKRRHSDRVKPFAPHLLLRNQNIQRRAAADISEDPAFFRVYEHQYWPASCDSGPPREPERQRKGQNRNDDSYCS